ncbi:MAG: tetratricopeptide repeat protein [Defluviitaleaceae bacterium]|nr:tetratricopeptide repeat protein [Defluviitaleaceae bacterium]
MAIEEKIYGEEYFKTTVLYNNMGLAYHASGIYEEALKYHRKALVARKKFLGEKHSATANSYNNIGEIYLKLKNIVTH